MVTFKCKMCGGALEITENQTVCECEYCGSKQTVPVLDEEKKAKLYERANKLRMNCEFDKAASVYESIVADYSDDAEGYWGLVLCRYGIEYVDDPATGKKIPTCHRSSFDSIMDDEDFEMVMENSDTLAREVYREQAKQIEEIRKGIIEVSGREEPYDIFICYKETDENGERTLDSVMAQDIYDVLTGKGYRVFFSRITLEDKLGVEYEPYIFAALNSAKVMLAFGTKYDYFNAVWVKNEWSRYLKLMTTDKEKHLIPCFKNIDAYDIPKEFAKLQAQDMGKVGADQDLIRGIEKICPANANNVNRNGNSISEGANNIEPLVKRAYMYLEDGEYGKANEYAERVLDMNPECVDCYIIKLLADLQLKKLKDLVMQPKSFDTNSNYMKIMRLGDKEIVDYLTQTNITIKECNENNKMEELYQKTLYIEKTAEDLCSEEKYLIAAEGFLLLKGYKDSDARRESCIVRAAEAAKKAEIEEKYSKAMDLYQRSDVEAIKRAKILFESISNYSPAFNMISNCDKRIEELKVLNIKKTKKMLTFIILGVVLAICIIIGCIGVEYNSKVIKPKQELIELMSSENALKGIYDTCKKYGVTTYDLQEYNNDLSYYNQYIGSYQFTGYGCTEKSGWVNVTNMSIKDVYIDKYGEVHDGNMVYMRYCEKVEKEQITLSSGDSIVKKDGRLCLKNDVGEYYEIKKK